MLVSIVSAVVILGLLIIVHEAGHFIVAKKLGVRVIRFSIGYPPKVWGIRRGETEYALGATPLGGYVRMLGDEVGDEPGSEDTESYLREVELDLLAAAVGEGFALKGALARADQILVPIAERVSRAESGMPMALGATAAAREADAEAVALAEFHRPLTVEERMLLEEIARTRAIEPAIKALSDRHPERLLERFRQRAFPSQPLLKRFAIVLAGPLANILFAPLLLSAIAMYGVPRILPIVGQIQAGMPAAAAGFRTGDLVTAINGVRINSWQELSGTVKSSNGAPLKVAVDRKTAAGVEHLTFTLRPKRQDEKTIFGNTTPVWIIGIQPHGEQVIDRVGPLRALYQGFADTVGMTVALASGIAQIVNGSTPVRQALGGPIMIAQMAGHEAHQGLANIAMFVVMLSLELGIINLLPVPMLDGGHLLFFACEAVRGKPLKLRHREVALQVGLLLLAALMAFVIFNDIARIVHS
jgi:regulator of sigma E protease